MGIEKEAIISEPNSGLYFHWSPYEEDLISVGKI